MKKKTCSSAGRGNITVIIFIASAGLAIKGKDKGEAENEEPPVDVRSPEAMTEAVKPEKLTTENTDKKDFRSFENSVNSVIASSAKKMRAEREERNNFPGALLYLNLFSVFSVVNY